MCTFLPRTLRLADWPGGPKVRGLEPVGDFVFTNRVGTKLNQCKHYDLNDCLVETNLSENVALCKKLAAYRDDNFSQQICDHVTYQFAMLHNANAHAYYAHGRVIKGRCYTGTRNIAYIITRTTYVYGGKYVTIFTSASSGKQPDIIHTCHVI